MSLDLSKLENVKSTPTGWTAMCPACALVGAGLRARNQLSILKSGQFHCAIASSSDPTHNREIHRLVRGQTDDIEYIDPEPRLKVDKIYPESTLDRLIPDYSYWIGRGIKADVVKRLEGGIAPLDEKSKLSGRAIFPIRGIDGRIMGFTGRRIVENSFSPNWKHLFRVSQTVWPWNVTGESITARKAVVLVESVADLLSLLSSDIPNVLCIFGLNVNSKIVSTLVAFDVKRVIVSLNNDKSDIGNRAADNLKARLEVFFSPDNVTVRLPQSAKDWNEATEEERQLFRTEIET